MIFWLQLTHIPVYGFLGIDLHLSLVLAENFLKPSPVFMIYRETQMKGVANPFSTYTLPRNLSVVFLTHIRYNS